VVPASQLMQACRQLTKEVNTCLLLIGDTGLHHENEADAGAGDCSASITVRQDNEREWRVRGEVKFGEALLDARSCLADIGSVGRQMASLADVSAVFLRTSRGPWCLSCMHDHPEDLRPPHLRDWQRLI